MSNQLIQSKALKDVIVSDAIKKRLNDIMGSRGAQFGAALVQIVNQSWSLSKCKPESVIGAALTAAALDLSIDPNLGEAHLVPYGETCQFQIGYIGFNQLAMRSGQYKNLGWKVVHKGELVHYDELSGELEVNSDHPDEEVIGYAAKFKLINGFERGSYWTKEACFKHAERYSKAYRAGLNDKNKRDSVWWTDPDRGCLKTVIKSLIKLWGPKSIQMQKALKMDEGAIMDVDTDVVTYPDNPAELKVSEPAFSEPPSGKPEKPVVEVEPPKSAAKPTQASEKAPSKPVEKPQAAESPEVAALKKALADAFVSEQQVLTFLRDMGVIDSKVKTIEELTKMTEVTELLEAQWADIVRRIKEEEGK